MTTADRQLIEHYVRRQHRQHIVLGVGFFVFPFLIGGAYAADYFTTDPVQRASMLVPWVAYAGPLALGVLGGYFLFLALRDSPTRSLVLQALQPDARNRVVEVKRAGKSTHLSGVRGRSQRLRIRLRFQNGQVRHLAIEKGHFTRVNNTLLR